MEKKFKLKKDGLYDGGDDEIMEWRVYNTTKDAENGHYKYKNNYEVKVIIKKWQDK